MWRPEPDGGGLAERKKGTQSGNWEKDLQWILQPKSRRIFQDLLIFFRPWWVFVAALGFSLLR